MTDELTLSGEPHDYLHYETALPSTKACFAKHSRAILRDAFQRILDDESDLESILQHHADRDDEHLGLLVRCAINVVAERYVHAHIVELEQINETEDDE